jgi:hypothetical protein
LHEVERERSEHIKQYKQRFAKERPDPQIEDRGPD